MAIDVTALTEAVAASKPGRASIVTLLTEYSTRLKAELANDPTAQAAIDAVTADVIAEATAISDAVAANPLP